MNEDQETLSAERANTPVSTTLGDLIFAIIEAAEETCEDGENANIVAHAVLGDLLRRNANR